MTTDDDDVYEQWVAYPDKRAYVHKDDHWSYANRGGWWVTDWLGTEGAVQEIGGKTEERRSRPKVV
jgi:hypothetical protein